MRNSATSRETIDFRYAPSSSWTPICRADDPHKTLVREDGALLYGFEQAHLGCWTFRRVIEFRAQTTHAPLAVGQHTEDARTPIVVTSVDYPTCRLELRAAGHRTDDGRRYDVVLWSIRVADDVDELLAGLHVDIHERGDVRHTGRSTVPDRRIYAGDPASVPAFPPFLDDVSEPDPERSAPGELVLLSSPHRLAPTHASGFRPASGLRTIPTVAAAGQTVRGALILPLDGDDVDGIDLAWAEAAHARERRYWAGLDMLDPPFSVPDQDLRDMLTAATRTIMQARDSDASGHPVFQVGPTVYRGLWIADGHFLLEAARYLRLDTDAWHGIRTLLDRVRADGSINALADQPGLAEHPHLKETGIAVATLVRQWELTGDDGWLRDVWPVVRGAVDHISELRRRARDLPRDSPARDLMPPAFSDGGVAGGRPELTTALWTLAGLKHAARAARRLAPDDAARIEETYGRLLADLRRAMREYAETLPDGTPYVPMILPGSGRHDTLLGVDDPPVHDRIRPESATWALAHAIWPGEVFDPDEPVVRDFLHLLDTLDGREGIPATTGWLPYRAVWTYYASFAAHAYLYAGRPDKARELLYAFCDHAAPTRVWREEQPLTGAGHDDVWGDMPHGWASAELIRLVRHLIVFERENTLELLPGVPGSWVEDDEGVRVERTPTRFGLVSVAARRPAAGAPGTVDVTVEPYDGGVGFAGECVLHVPATGPWRVEFNDSHVETVEGPTWLRLPGTGPRHDYGDSSRS